MNYNYLKMREVGCI